MVIGAGIAGSEASWQIAQHGIEVELYEMRPVRPTAAHKTDQFSELVCSNSFGSDNPGSASRMLKDEIRSMGSLTLEVARECSVPAGASLAVDRNLFAQMITERLSSHPKIKIKREEVLEIPNEGVIVLATGPLTSDSLSNSLGSLLGTKSLYFYDAISPIVATDSLDLSQMFLQIGITKVRPLIF